MRTTIIMLLGLGLFGQAGADPFLEGHVRLPSGAPVAGAQVLLFDLADLRAAPRAATTDRSGRFTLPPARDRALPQGFELGANYPNPFNPSTMIPYRLPASMHVRLEVFNLLGQRIATLVDGEQPAGFHTAQWDATDASGAAVGAGVYLYRLSGDEMRATRSMLLIDGQAGIPSAGRSREAAAVAVPADEAGRDGAPVYGLTVSAPGRVPYVDPAFRVEAGMAPLDVVLEAPGSAPSAKAASSDRILGDVDNTGGVGFFDALLVALYSQDSRLVMPNGGDISLGDVNADGRVDLSDAWLIAAWLDDPSDPTLPDGIGEPVAAEVDLIVISPSVSDNTLTPGQSFRLRATVRNQGTGRSAATTLRYYRSSDATIAASDARVGTDNVSGLSASGTSVESISLRAPSNPGTYYYGACVVSVSGESDTNNNCSAGVRVTVSRSDPDLIVISPSVSDNTLTPSQSFTLRATVRNQGTGRAAATTLRYYRSSDRTISTRDTRVGTDHVGALGASATSAESISLTAPSSAGTYYYGACVASVSGESDTNNNCSAGVRVTVSRSDPDLVVISPSVSDNTLTPGQSFTLRATVRNQGTGRSAATTLRYYRSSDATIAATDVRVGTDNVSGLSASGTSAESISLRAPTSPGTYYYGACVVSVSGESDTGNNCSRGVRVTVSGGTETEENVPTRLTRHSDDDYAPAWSPDGTQIAFTSDRDGNDEIYVMAADGSQQTRLTRNSAWDTDPAWSPDGTQIAFTSDRDGNNEIYVMAADGSQPTRLTRNNACGPLPLRGRPTVRRLPLRPERGGNPSEIYVMAADGSQPTRLTRNSAWATDPAWSPDGTQIAFASERDGNYEIYVMAADGSQQTRLTRNSARDSSPKWSPDGTQIAFTSDRDAGNDEIYVMAADGSQPTRLTRNHDLDWTPAWSPDGTQIAFASERDGNSGIYVMAAKPETGGDSGELPRCYTGMRLSGGERCRTAHGGILTCPPFHTCTVQ